MEDLILVHEDRLVLVLAQVYQQPYQLVVLVYVVLAELDFVDDDVDDRHRLLYKEAPLVLHLQYDVVVLGEVARFDIDLIDLFEDLLVAHEALDQRLAHERAVVHMLDDHFQVF